MELEKVFDIEKFKDAIVDKVQYRPLKTTDSYCASQRNSKIEPCKL